MTNYQFAFLTSTTHPGFLSAPPLTLRPDADMVVAGVAWDGATTNRPGARFGPYAIRRASHMLCDGEHPLFNVSAGASIADIGDLWTGMDLCEVAPAYDHADLTSNAAATLVWTYLCGRLASRSV